MLGAAVVAATVSYSVAFATMPSAPVAVTIESAGPVAVDVDLTITLVARPMIDVERLSATITLPPGVDLIAGETSWTGAVRAREDRTLTITVRPRRAESAVIRGAVRMEFSDGTKLGETRSLRLDLGERPTPGASVAPPQTTISGEPVIEFRDNP
jgi:hypothetical protein